MKYYRNSKGQFIGKTEHARRKKISKSLHYYHLKKELTGKGRPKFLKEAEKFYKSLPKKLGKPKRQEISSKSFTGHTVKGRDYYIPKNLWQDRNLKTIVPQILNKYKRTKTDTYAFWRLQVEIHYFQSSEIFTENSFINTRAEILQSALDFTSEFIEDLYSEIETRTDTGNVVTIGGKEELEKERQPSDVLIGKVNKIWLCTRKVKK